MIPVAQIPNLPKGPRVPDIPAGSGQVNIPTIRAPQVRRPNVNIQDISGQIGAAYGRSAQSKTPPTLRGGEQYQGMAQLGAGLANAGAAFQKLGNQITDAHNYMVLSQYREAHQIEFAKFQADTENREDFENFAEDWAKRHAEIAEGFRGRMKGSGAADLDIAYNRFNGQDQAGLILSTARMVSGRTRDAITNTLARQKIEGNWDGARQTIASAPDTILPKEAKELELTKTFDEEKRANIEESLASDPKAVTQAIKDDPGLVWPHERERILKRAEIATEAVRRQIFNDSLDKVKKQAFGGDPERWEEYKRQQPQFSEYMELHEIDALDKVFYNQQPDTKEAWMGVHERLGALNGRTFASQEEHSRAFFEAKLDIISNIRSEEAQNQLFRLWKRYEEETDPGLQAEKLTKDQQKTEKQMIEARRSSMLKRNQSSIKLVPELKTYFDIEEQGLEGVEAEKRIGESQRFMQRMDNYVLSHPDIDPLKPDTMRGYLEEFYQAVKDTTGKDLRVRKSGFLPITDYLFAPVTLPGISQTTQTWMGIRQAPSVQPAGNQIPSREERAAKILGN